MSFKGQKRILKPRFSAVKTASIISNVSLSESTETAAPSNGLRLNGSSRSRRQYCLEAPGGPELSPESSFFHEDFHKVPWHMVKR